MGFAGLATDIQTVLEKLQFRTSLYELKEGRKIKPKTFAAMLSNLLYERRFGPFFIEPIVAGIDPETKECYICSMDLIGCKTEPADFVVSGTAEEQLYGNSLVLWSFHTNFQLPSFQGMCETLWSENLKPDELFESAAQALINAADRDAITGWGSVVHVIEPHQITTRKVKTRMD